MQSAVECARRSARLVPACTDLLIQWNHSQSPGVKVHARATCGSRMLTALHPQRPSTKTRVITMEKEIVKKKNFESENNLKLVDL